MEWSFFNRLAKKLFNPLPINAQAKLSLNSLSTMPEVIKLFLLSITLSEKYQIDSFVYLWKEEGVIPRPVAVAAEKSEVNQS